MNIPSWDSEWLFPIAETEINMEQLTEIADGYLVSDSSGQMNLVFDETVFDFSIDTIVSFPDTTIQEIFFIPIGNFTLYPGQQIPFTNDTIETFFDLGETQINLITLKEGKIDIELQNTIDEAVIINFFILDSDSAGNRFDVTEKVNANSTLKKSYDVSNYSFDLRGVKHTSFNTISASFNAIIDPLGNPVIFNFDNVSVKFTLKEVAPYFARGYFGNIFQEIPFQTEEKNFLFNVPGIDLDFSSASIELNIENYTGIDLELNNLQLSTVNMVSGKSATLSSPLIDGNFHINRAVNTNNRIEGVKSKTLSLGFTESNSNIHELISTIPDRFSFGANVEVNPLGNVSGGNDFIFADKGMEVKVNARIPLTFYINKFHFVDTLDFNPDSVKLPKAIGRLILQTENSFPFGFHSKLYFYDADFNLLDSLVNVNSDGLIEPNSSVNYYNISTEKGYNIMDSKHILVELSAIPESNTEVYSVTSKMKVKLTLSAEAKVTFEKELVKK